MLTAYFSTQTYLLSVVGLFWVSYVFLAGFATTILSTAVKYLYDMDILLEANYPIMISIPRK